MNIHRYWLIAIMMLTSPSVGQEKPQIWLGVLDVGVAKLRLEIRVEQPTPDSYQGIMVSLDQGNVEIPFDSIKIVDDTLQFRIEKLHANFTGKRTVAGDYEGIFTQFGNDRELTFKLMTATSVPKLVETWQGNMTAGREFEFQLRIFEDKDGKRSGVLDSFTENITGLPIELNANKESTFFNFEVEATKATYEGEYADDRKSIIGKWKQGGGEFDLKFAEIELAATRTAKSGSKKSTASRPQTPKPPFDYPNIEFVVSSKTDEQIELAGTLSLPKGDGPFPAAILISGSGPQDRDCTIFGHKSFLVIADHFAKQGIAVLRYDERGVGKSKGDFTTATSEDFANDVEQLLDWLKEQPKIDKQRLVLIGHSEGGIVGPMVAARRPDVAKLVVLSGPFVDGERIVLNQSRKIAAISGASMVYLDSQETLLREVIHRINKGKPTSPEIIKSIQDDIISKLAEPERENFDFGSNTIESLNQLSSPWFKFYLTYDPALTFDQVKCPVLVINGDKDLQVDPDLNLPVASKILQKRTNKDWEIIRPENLNHLFQTAETGSPNEYPQIEETFNLEVLQTITDWVLGK